MPDTAQPHTATPPDAAVTRDTLYPHALVLCQGPCRRLYPHHETVLVNNGIEERRSCYDCLPDVCDLASAFPEEGSSSLSEVA